jgi:hypothetical protein
MHILANRGSPIPFQKSLAQGKTILSNLPPLRPLSTEALSLTLHSFSDGAAKEDCTLPFFILHILNGSHMIGKYKIITLCGNAKFKDEFIAEFSKIGNPAR